MIHQIMNLILMNLLQTLIIIHPQMIVVQKMLILMFIHINLKLNLKHKNEIHENLCDPMIYHILNDNDMYTYDPNIALNNECYEKNIVILK